MHDNWKFSAIQMEGVKYYITSNTRRKSAQFSSYILQEGEKVWVFNNQLRDTNSSRLSNPNTNLNEIYSGLEGEQGYFIGNIEWVTVGKSEVK